MKVLHRIDDAALALSTEPHRGFLLKALKHAPTNESSPSIWAARVLHRELLPYTVARDVVDPEGLLLLEADPEGQALNLAALTLRPGSNLFPLLLAELHAMRQAMGFSRLECRSRRRGMKGFLLRHGWVWLPRVAYQPADFESYGYFGPHPVPAFAPRTPARHQQPDEHPTLADLPEGFPFFRGDE